MEYNGYMLEAIATFILRLFGLKEGTRLYGSLEFFIADTMKIFLLLIVIIFVVSIIRSYLPPNRIRKLLAGKNSLYSSILAAIVGIFTPFCTCSAIPLFLGFIEAGVPIGATFSFLISSPMVNEVALIMLLGMFGWKIAAIYTGFGLVIAIISGLLIGRLGAEKWIIKAEAESDLTGTGVMPFEKRVNYAKRYTIYIVKKVWLYIIIGIAIGAGIHGYVPVNYLAGIASRDHWYAVPAAVLLGVPLYSNAAGIIPLVSVLTEKGVAIGTVLAFMMSVTGLSFPEFMILKRVMRWQLLIIFISIVAVSIMIAGFLFNAIIH